MRTLLSVLSLVLLFLAASATQCSLPFSPSRGGIITIVSYNAQNLFDAQDDGGEYPEFRLESGGWSAQRYRQRLENTAKAVRSLLGDGNPGPDILCLVEVENARVLEGLRDGPFSRTGYRSLIMVPSGASPVNNGILSRFAVLSCRTHNLECEDSGGRFMLEVHFDCGPAGPLTMFLCHWKSRREGDAETEEARIQAAALLRGRISGILAEDAGARIVVCGDFNESPDEYLHASGRETAFIPLEAFIPESPPAGFRGLVISDVRSRASSAVLRPVLYSPWAESDGYSYVFQGREQRLDGFLLSPGLLDGSGLEMASFEPAQADFLVAADGSPRSWRGDSGYSDHLPILLTLSGRE